MDPCKQLMNDTILLQQTMLSAVLEGGLIDRMKGGSKVKVERWIPSSSQTPLVGVFVRTEYFSNRPVVERAKNILARTLISDHNDFVLQLYYRYGLTQWIDDLI
jgi:hypothetical protein